MALDYFTLAEVRALPDVDDTTLYPDADVTAEGEAVQALVERVCATSFVARETVEVLDGTGTGCLTLKTPYVLSITSVVINGITATDQFTVDAGILERRAAGTFGTIGWPAGRRNVVVTYDAGYATAPPADLKRAMLRAVRNQLISRSEESAIDDRRISMQTEQGSVALAVADDEHPTGYPEIDSVINGYARRTNLVTFP